MTLLMMLLTAATAWAADITQNTAVVINSSNKATYHNKSITGTVPSSSSAGTFTVQQWYYSSGAIVVDGIDLNLTIDGFNVDYHNEYAMRSCISLVNNATLHLTVKGTNTLKAGFGGAGIAVPYGCTLEITAGSTGTLTAIGGESYGGGAGIGSIGDHDNTNQGSSSIYPQGLGTITINGGTINAQGGTWYQNITPCGGAAGIGSSDNSGATTTDTSWGSTTYLNNVTGSIIINGGTVSATGGVGAAGIGGGSTGTLQAITITGGTVTATPGSRAAAIGTGYNGFNTNCGSLTGATINITGGTVTANGNIGFGDAVVASQNVGGSIALSWTNLTDAIRASAYDAATVTVSSNFMLQGTQTAATTANIGGQTIVPKVTVSFNANGHGTAPAATATAYGFRINAPTVSEVPSYVLSGWYKESSCTNQWNFSSDVVTSNITLYAKWVTDPGYITGSGTVNDPYVISSLAQWNRFASDSKYYVSGTYVKLGGYISGVTTTVGTQSNPFKGTFDGGGYTLAVSISETSTQGTAPFREINGATIKNLTVTGSVTGTTHAAGLVGFARSGSNTIENCNVSASVTVNTGSNKHCGGLVGHAITSTLNITNCIYSGTISNGGNYAGGLQGWSDGNTLNITNSLFSGSYTGSGSFHPIAVRNNNATMLGTISGAYYTAAPTLTNANYIAAAGTQAYTSRQSFLCQSATIQGTTVYYAADFTPFGMTDTYTPDGTEAHPFIISTTAGWEYFCDALLDNDTWNRFSGMTVKLGADISVTRMAGSSEHEFCGTFDGGGHTLTFNYGSTGVSQQYIAPFHFVSHADNDAAVTIKNLRVCGDIFTSAKNAAGIIGKHWATVNLENCRSSINIVSSVSGDGTHGGLSGGQQNGTLNIEGCLFDGSIIGSTTNRCGGFVGWRSGTVNISNSLFAPTEVTLDLDGETNYYSATFSRNGVSTITNSYYTQAFGTAQGKQARSITADEYVTVAIADAATVYSTSGITTYGTGIKYGDVIYAGSGETVSLTLTNTLPPYYVFSSYNVSPDGATLTEDGDNYTLTMPDADVTIGATFTEVDKGTEANPYIIYDWDTTFYDWMTNDYDYYKDKYFKLGADITATKMVGEYSLSSSRPFCGTFDGNGHTLTVNYGSAESPVKHQCCAPFVYVKDATIKNLHVAGNITVKINRAFAGGIVGDMYHGDGSLTLENCRSSVTITNQYGSSESPSYADIGGLIGACNYPKDTTTIRGCVFDGKLIAENGYEVGGFVGRKDARATVNIYNSLSAPQEISAGDSLSGTFCGKKAPTTISNSYYTQTLGTVQGSEGILLYDGGVPATANAGIISRNNEEQYTVKLQGRKLYKDGDWNTLCLPFDVSTTSGPLSGDNVTAMVLNGENSGLSGTTLTLNFDNAPETIPAGTPFIIRWGTPESNPGTTLTNPAFTGVTVSDDTNDVDFTGGSFKGTYAPMSWDAEDRSILFLGTSNKLHWPLAGAHINACRAYFQLTDGASAREFNLNFGDGSGDATRLNDNVKLINDNEADAWYTIDGVRLNGKPTTKGLYIHNGRKVVVK